MGEYEEKEGGFLFGNCRGGISFLRFWNLKVFGG